jgi:hypothetical protein
MQRTTEGFNFSDERSEEMNKVVNDFSRKLFGMSQERAIALGICLSCKEHAMSKCYSDAGKKEYKISALCEECFDEMCGEDDVT